MMPKKSPVKAGGVGGKRSHSIPKPRTKVGGGNSASMSAGSACSCYEICQFPEPPVGDYRCPLDGGVLRDAVRSRKCMHTYGMQCVLTYLLKVEEACPVCGIGMDCSDLEPAERLRNEVQALPISCRELDSCHWVGMVCEEADHANGPDCGLQLILCPFCDRRIRAGEEFDQHKDTCPEAILICPECFEDMPRKELPMHKAGLGGRKCQLSEPMRHQKEAERRRSAEQEAARREARVLEAHREREEQRARERTEQKKRREEDPTYLSFYSQHPNASINQNASMFNRSSIHSASPHGSIARSATRSLDSELRGVSMDRPSICHEDYDEVALGYEDALPPSSLLSPPAPRISKASTPRGAHHNASVRSSTGKKILLSPISKQHPASASGVRTSIAADPVPVIHSDRATSAPVDTTGARSNVRPLSPTTIVQDARFDSYFDGTRHMEEDGGGHGGSHYQSGASGFSPLAPEGAYANLVSIIDELRNDREKDREAMEAMRIMILELEGKHSELELRHFKLQSTVSEIVDVVAENSAEPKKAAASQQQQVPQAVPQPSAPIQEAKREPSPPTTAPPVLASARETAPQTVEQPAVVVAPKSAPPAAPTSQVEVTPPVATTVVPTRTTHKSVVADPQPIITKEASSSQPPRPAPKQTFVTSAVPPPKVDHEKDLSARPSSRPSSQVASRKGSASSAAGGHQAALDFVFSGMKKPQDSKAPTVTTRRESNSQQPPAPPTAGTPTSTSSASGRAKGKESANPRIRKAAFSAATPERDGVVAPSSSASPKRTDLKYTHKVNVGGKTPNKSKPTPS